MSGLIRYEDKYGMSTMFSNLNALESETRGDISIYRGTNLYYRNGLSNAKVLKITFNEAILYKSYGITDVYFVFDLDNPSDNSKIISIEFVNKRIEQLIDLRNKAKWCVKYHFVPVVYTAETIALYQFFSGNRSLTSIINRENTKLLHLNLLHVVTGEKDTKKLKHYNFIDADKLRENLLKFRKIDKFNNSAIALLLNCISDDQFPTEQGVLPLLQEIMKQFEQYKDADCFITYRGVKYCVSSNEYIQQFKVLGALN